MVAGSVIEAEEEIGDVSEEAMVIFGEIRQ